MNNKLLWLAVLVVAIVAVGAYFYPKVGWSFGSPAGTSFGDAKFAGVAISLASPGANGTSTSILNSDAGTRFVTGWVAGCTGVGTSLTAYTGLGLASLQMTIGTTSTAAPAGLPAALPVANAFVLSTSTTVTFAASTTLQTGSAYSASWPTGTYMTFGFNATNTAACTVGVHYVQS